MKPSNTPWALAAVTSLLALSGCGGDDATPLVTSNTTTFTGVAATGAAMAGAEVKIVCAGGTATGTTNGTGSYSIGINNITLPCLFRATGTDGTVLYSVGGTSAGTTQTANITPLTHLLLASLAGTNLSSFFTAFDASTASTVTASNVSAAQAAVLATLSNAGLDVSSLVDLVGGNLAAGSHSGYDGILDAVKTMLAAGGTDLTALTNSIITGSPAAPAATNTHAPSLPASQLLKPAAANCTALRSGEFVVVQPQKDSTLSDQISTSTLNASTLVWTESDSSTTTFTAADDCTYTSGGDTYLVAKSGIIMGVNSDQPVKGLTIAIPKQTIPVSALAGSWNALGFQKNNAGTAYVAETITADISSDGVFTNLNECVGARLNDTCTASNTTINLVSNSTGGFDWIGSGTNTWSERAFAYRAGSGDLMLLTLGGGGSIHIWTKQRTLNLPTVGDLLTGGASVRVNNQLLAGTLDIFPNGASVAAIDATAGTVTRTQTTLSGAADYNDTVTLNSPRPGFNIRAAGTTVSQFDGRTVTIRERTSLGIRGMGIAFQSVPHVSSFQMSVD
ncbi:MAG: hypothetical protein NTZ15_01605 [Burkholderiales bacterium]|nr:hypothetical protein [Burkholderiales bacterium]